MTTPLLPFDAPVEPPREPIPSPVARERQRLNAAALRVLAFLQTHPSATNVQLSAPNVGGLRFGGRLHELRKDGWDIERHHVSGGTWRYELRGYK